MTHQEFDCLVGCLVSSGNSLVDIHRAIKASIKDLPSSEKTKLLFESKVLNEWIDSNLDELNRIIKEEVV